MASPRNNRREETREDLEKREKALAREKRKQAQLHADRARLLQMPEFQRVMAEVMVQGHMFSSVMTGNSQTYHLSGRQDFCREIWHDLARANQDLAFDLLKPKFEEDS